MSERGYLDGVPLRLNSKYYPQPRPQFKEIDIHIPIDALQDDYDFSLERSVIAEVKTWEENKRIEDEKKLQEAIKRAEEEERLAEEARKQAEADEIKRLEDEERRAAEEKQLQLELEERLRLEEIERVTIEQERIRLEEENKEKLAEEIKLKNEELESETSQDSEQITPVSETIAAVDTLPPAVIDPEFKLSNSHEKPNQSILNNSDNSGLPINPCNTNLYNRSSFRPGADRNARINLSDFESDTANPFDNVELKSINEMEVLASVLKNNSVTVPQNQHLEFQSDPRSVTNTNYGNRVPPQIFPGTSYPEPYIQQYNYTNSQWNPNNYFIPGSPSAPEIAGRVQQQQQQQQTPAASSAPTNHTNIPASSANSFTKYYFPLLTSMADSRSMRDRQNQFSTNLNQGYQQQQIPSSTNPTLGSTCQNPFLNPSQSPNQQFPILGSLSHSPSHHYWPDGNPGITVPASYNISNHQSMNRPLVNDAVHNNKSNNSHLPSSDLSSSTSNGTQPTLR